MEIQWKLHQAHPAPHSTSMPGHFAQHCLLGLEVRYLSTVEQEELLLQLLAAKDTAGASSPDEPALELAQKESGTYAPLLSMEEDFFSQATDKVYASVTGYFKTEELQDPLSDIQISSPGPKPPPLVLSKPHQYGPPAWECQLPWRYVVASTSSVDSLCLNVEIETMDTQQAQGVTALLDSRAT
ncbi:hypothetical protein C0993_006885 [Termitomyces sp. T159_Od127]|nr:hypothetical protein C0993_006885 [Termitomyces sp. T159_Od127]